MRWTPSTTNTQYTLTFNGFDAIKPHAVHIFCSSVWSSIPPCYQPMKKIPHREAAKMCSAVLVLLREEKQIAKGTWKKTLTGSKTGKTITMKC